MLSPDSPSLAIERSPRSHATVVAAVILVLGVTPWLLPRISVPFAGLLMIVTLTSGAFALWQLGWFGGVRAVHKAIWAADGEWHLLDAKGSKYLAILHPTSQVMGPIIWLRFSSVCGPRDLLFLGASLAPELRRQLVVRLRLQGSKAPQEPAGRSAAHRVPDTGGLL